MRGIVILLLALQLATATAAKAQTKVETYPGTATLQSASLTSSTCPGTGCLTSTVTAWGGAAIQVAGTWSGTITFRGSVDGTNFIDISCTTTASGQASRTTTTTNGIFTCGVGGMQSLRVVMTTYSSGTASVTSRAVLNSVSGRAGGGINEFDVRSYGAQCDGSTDDTAALQAAANAAEPTSGTVVLPAGDCRITDTVTFGNLASGSAGGYSAISLRGQGPYSTRIAYSGSTDGRAALMLRHMSAFHWQRFSLEGPSNTPNSVAQGASVGIQVDGCSPACGTGTASTYQVFDSVHVSGFFVGVQNGGSNNASEFTCRTCGFFNCGTGMSNVTGQNTLNFWFYDTHLGGNDIGIKMEDGVHVSGGDTYGSLTADFYQTSAFGVLTIDHVRSEITSPAKFLSGSGGNAVIVLRDNVINVSDKTTTVIDLLSEQCVLTSNSIQGKIGSVTCNQLSMSLNGVIEGTANWPITVPSSDMLVVNLWHNYDSNVGVTGRYNYPDRRGVVTSSGYQEEWLTPHDAGDTTANGLWLSGVRGIALGSTVRGRNLRDRVVFATSATAAVTFVKTKTVTTTSGLYSIGFTAGDVTAADIGKYISIASACGGGTKALEGRIETVTSATTGTVATIPWYNVGATKCREQIDATGSKTATIGENEPDANYFISLACDKQETFSWSSKATTGFTLTSSNAASVATCDVMILR